MLLPMPAIPRQEGPGSAYALKQKPWLQAILVGEAVCVAVKLFIKLDIMGGFIDCIVIGLGCYALSQEMNIQWICYFAMMGLYQGVLGLVRHIDVAVHGQAPLIGLSSAWAVFFDFVQLSDGILAILMLCGTYQGWRIYKEFTTGTAPLPLWSTSSSTSSAERAPLTNGRSVASFKAFQGSGNKLGGTA
eukprot:TRINITY_DN75660_c0_g1_i1.p1 TRINITY_DN75660_c0_g1~~TRINITY_DN75660_c0_g1_i1.p1  ORF type:complete len:189 (-),score=26.97 TRINITY_DN75660_c0_g1_i1:133-699(-)